MFVRLEAMPGGYVRISSLLPTVIVPSTQDEFRRHALRMGSDSDSDSERLLTTALLLELFIQRARFGTTGITVES